jgi:hypothetical protein
VSEIEPYRSGSIIPSKQARQQRAIVSEARAAGLRVRGSEFVTREVMDSLRRVDDYRMSLANDNDMLNVMLKDAEISHNMTCVRIQSDLYQQGPGVLAIRPACPVATHDS